METRLVAASVIAVKTPLLVLPTFGNPWRDPLVQAVDQALGGALRSMGREEGFKGKAGQTLTVAGARGLGASRVAVIGLDREQAEPAESVATFAARAGRLARAKGLQSFALAVPSLSHADQAEAVRWCTEGAASGVYRFVRHKGSDQASGKETKAVTLVLAREGKSPARVTRTLRASMEAGTAAAAAVRFARDLINEPPNVLTPTELAKRARAMAAEVGLEVTVLGPKEIQRRKMRLLEAVAQGSKEPPRFIHLVHKPRSGSSRGRVVLVGKGITFDSGGLSLKPPKGQIEMKGDMGGAAVVLGTLRAAAVQDVPYEVHGIVPATENMPGGGATRPGDVVAGMNGKTVEILNTDAEGRLVLADALAYAVDLRPDVLIDHATLTGACMMALGQNRAGFWATDDGWAGRYAEAAARAGEAVWRMPLAEELREGLKSEVADLKNIGGAWGGAITAALFLREFAGKAPWIHVDIAGPSYLEKPHAFYPKGGTGFGILSLLELLRR